MLHTRQVLLLTLLCSMTGCSLFIPSSQSKPIKDAHLKVSLSAKHWVSTDPRESDHAWVESRRGDVIIVNSFCGEFQALSLETLALKTFQDYQEFKPLGERHLTWHGREAFEMEAQARVDGVQVLLHLRNYRRDHCYYDFVLISPREQHPESLSAFEQMIEGARFQ